jgi:hypothetical protein
MHANTQAGQFSWWPSISGSTTRNTAGTAMASPARSRRRPRAGTSAGTTSGTRASTASPIGTLTRNTGRQAEPNRFAVTSTPPITCPATNPEDSTAVYALSARARAAPLNRTWITLMICGIIAAAPAPWTNLAAIRTSIPGAIPQISDATVNTRTPMRNIRRRPYRSPIRAPVISIIA